MERKLQHIEQFGPILVETLCRMLEAPKARLERAEKGMEKLLGRDTKEAVQKLSEAEVKFAAFKEKHSHLADLIAKRYESICG